MATAVRPIVLSGTLLNRGKDNFDGMRQEPAQVDWRMLFDGKRASGKWDVFISVQTRVQDMAVSVRVKGKAGKLKQVWMAREIVALVKSKNEAWARYRPLSHLIPCCCSFLITSILKKM